MDNATGALSQRRKTGWIWILPMITLYLAINRISFTTFMVILAVCVVILQQDLRRDPRQPSDSGDTPVPSVKVDSSNFTWADVSHSDDPSFFVRSNALWLEDGNFVILVQSTAFRFYGGLLSIHSPIFKDMFSLPQPRGVERFDGCPFIRLYDSAEDFSYFLQVLLGTIILDVETTPIHAIAAILRISTKYEASMIRQRCIKVLELTYPSTLAGWLQSPSSEAIGSSEELHLRHFHIANLARETNALNILPVALLMCCMGTLPDIMDGMVLPDGYRVELCPENRRAVLIGRQALSHLARTETHKNLFSINDLPGCIKSTACRAERSRKAEWLLQQSTDDWLSPLISKSYTGVLCTPCRTVMKEAIREARVKIWNNLPVIFKLGESWNDLERATSNL